MSCRFRLPIRPVDAKDDKGNRQGYRALATIVGGAVVGSLDQGQQCLRRGRAGPKSVKLQYRASGLSKSPSLQGFASMKKVSSKFYKSDLTFPKSVVRLSISSDLPLRIPQPSYSQCPTSQFTPAYHRSPRTPRARSMTLNGGSPPRTSRSSGITTSSPAR